MIPEEKIEPVTRALHEAFGVAEFDDIRRMSAGHTTSHVFRIVVRGTPYLLKIIMRTEDPTRHFTCLRGASDGGVAPRLWYANTADRITITDFVEPAPFAMTDAVTRMPALLRTLHALPPFPVVPDAVNTSCLFLLNKGPALDGFLQKFQASNGLPPAETQELLARYAKLAAAYSRDSADMVSSHNDLFKPDNIIFEGSRIWLVDWETGFLNDRYADLAVVANMVVNTADEERAYLREYFGQEPDAGQRARFFLMQQLAHVFYTMAFLFMVTEPVDLSQSVPDLSEFHRRMWAGEAILKDKQTKVAYGLAHRERLLRKFA